MSACMGSDRPVALLMTTQTSLVVIKLSPDSASFVTPSNVKDEFPTWTKRVCTVMGNVSLTRWWKIRLILKVLATNTNIDSENKPNMSSCISVLINEVTPLSNLESC